MGASDLVCLNSRLVPREDARISPFDRGFLYGDGFFETTRIVSGRALFLDRHLTRLAGSCRETGFDRDLECARLADDVHRLVAANAVSEGYLRITVSRGIHGGRLAELAATAPTVFVEARAMALPPLACPPPLVLARSSYARDERNPLVRHKSLSYQLNALALAEGRRSGADEVYLLNSAGHLAEGAVTNLFLVQRGVVLTPDVSCGLLPGITRQAVLDLCGKLGVDVQLGTFPEADLAAAEEVFCTNSLRGVVGVRRVVAEGVRDLVGGPVTARIQAGYAQAAHEACRAVASEPGGSVSVV